MLNVEENEDEEIFFTPVSSSNLASLFNTTMLLPNQNNDASLTYKPPKQPSANSLCPTSPTKSTKIKYQSSVILFKEIHAFQLINKEYSPIGKCGLALIGNEQVRLYQLLIYKQKNNIISTTKVTTSFEFIVQKNNYITINDDKKLTWTIHFNNEADLKDFSKIMSNKCMSKIVTTEEHEKLKEQKKRSIQVENTGNENISKTEDTKAEKLVNSKTKDVIAEERVDKVENKNKEINEDIPVKYNTNGEGEHIHKNNDSETSDSSGTANKKADILSRIAKMGKKIIAKPSPTSDTCDIDESNKLWSELNSHKKNDAEDMSEEKQVLHEKNCIADKKHNVSGPVYNSNSQMCGNVHSPQPYIPMRNESIVHLRPSLNHQVIVPFPDAAQSLMYPSAHLPADQLNMFFAENRMHSSEIRMNMMKLQSGIDEVLNLFKRPDSGKYEIFSQTEESEDSLIKENERLSKLISENEKTISALRLNLETYKKKNEDLLHKETDHTCEIASLTQETARCAYEEHKLNLKIKEQQTQLSIQATKIAEYEEKLKFINLTNCDCVHIKKTKLPEIKDSIKEQMNLFYNEACGIFKGDATYDGNHIKKILAPIIIDNTYKMLNTLNELFSSSED